ncbi:MAG TPA: carboxypeptidase-like regulatory domain-containing protein [Paenalcaligenes sp.]|nr:carboxypeptidase-like regulatory domain-containing protein [Paenalcaligenes sp.]
MSLFNTFHRGTRAVKLFTACVSIAFSAPLLAADDTDLDTSVGSGLQLGELERSDAPAVADEPASQLPALQYHNGIPYITGGIGSDEATVFKEQRRKFPLSLNFGQEVGDRTAYAADVQVVIRDEDDHTIFNINSEGPYCLVDLEPGDYEVHVTYMGNTETRNFTIKQGEPVEINIRWPSDLSDGSIKSLKEDLKEELM